MSDEQPNWLGRDDALRERAEIRKVLTDALGPLPTDHPHLIGTLSRRLAEMRDASRAEADALRTCGRAIAKTDRESDATGCGPTLLPYQQHWADDQSATKLWDADRQIGSTFAALHEAAAHIQAGRRVLWIANDSDDIRRAISDFSGTASDVLWCHGLSPNDLDLAFLALGRHGVVFVDNAPPTESLYVAIETASVQGVAVRVILSGAPGLVDSWSKFYAPSAWHTTTIMDAMADGVGRLMANAQGVEWSHAWEFGHLASLAELYDGRPDSPRFDWPAEARDDE